MPAKSRVALITGGASGIGKATAELFAEKGYRTVLLDISPKGEQVAEAIRKRHQDCTYMKCDVSKESQVNEAISRSLKKHGRIDCLLNVAGVVLVRPLEETTWGEYSNVFNINVGGTFLTCKYTIPIMKRQRSGSIVNMASVSGHVGQVRHTLYGASKGAIIAFSRALAIELAPYRIRVNSLSPGSVDTPMLRSDVEGESKRLKTSFKKVKSQREAEQAFGRWADPREIAEAVYFLASDSASFITGTDLLVDAGWTAK